MEYNKEEALRAKGIAEKKFEAKNFAGAKKFALKAQNLYPALDGIRQMIATVEVYIASDRRINGEKDWYAILSVSPSADDDTLKKQYRKLVLLLHPDKNKSVGADPAFQFISEAWKVLSDKGQRSWYDIKRGTKEQQPRPFPSYNNRSVPRTAAPQPSAASGRSNARRPSVLSDMFWTCCSKCTKRQEILRSNIDKDVSCSYCGKPFIAKEEPVKARKTKSAAVPGTGSPGRQRTEAKTARPKKRKAGSENPNVASSSARSAKKRNTADDAGAAPEAEHVVPGTGSSGFQQMPFSQTAGSASASASSVAAEQAANSDPQIHEKVGRQRKEAKTARPRTRKAGSENPNVTSRSARSAKKRNTADDAGAAPEAEHVVPGTGSSGFQQMPFSQTAGSASASASSVAAEQAANSDPQIHEKVGRQRKEAKAARPRKRKAGSENPNVASSSARSAKKRNTADDAGTAPEAEHAVPDNLLRKLSCLDTKGLLIKRGKGSVRKKLEEWKSEEKEEPSVDD